MRTSDLGYLICESHLLRSRENKNLKKTNLKRPVFFQTYLTYSELPSDLNTIYKRVKGKEAKKNRKKTLFAKKYKPMSL